MRYEPARGTSILDIHQHLQCDYGDDVKSRQMAGSKNKIPRVKSPAFSDMLSTLTPFPHRSVFIFHTLPFFSKHRTRAPNHLRDMTSSP
ncbi:hypothetical protein AVEN_155861-1 [Araneus ventricosus]|uniref:Uncharacterized protein n=1 Tax=Araneus ventricosus TaxID=182803 RepID=A0A4Y2MQ26_ARAVE|nr:hypothetical protein AVEN_155861-1 [Araneus ventricosus]